MSFGVVGAGIIGLSTALELQREFPNGKVTIISDRFNDDTTSWVAAGVFRPGTSFMGPSLDVTKKWISDSFHHWYEITRTAEAPKAGVTQISGYIFSKTSKSIVRNHYIEDILPVYRQATEEELKLCNGGWKFGSFFTTVLTDSTRFLPYAMERFKNAGGIVQQEKVDCLSRLGQHFDVVVNCTGMGAKYLCGDHNLVPLRGQVLKLKAPWIKMAFYGDYDTYIIPGFDSVTLGGCRQFDSYNMDVCKYDTLAIQERCFGMLPSLRKAPVIKEVVGLRPHRAQVRIESEILNALNGKSVKIVHNYGHGGYGVTTAPGTAKYAVGIVRDILASSGISKL